MATTKPATTAQADARAHRAKRVEKQHQQRCRDVAGVGGVMWQYGSLTVWAKTKSEARARIKDNRIPLPPGADVRRLSPTSIAS